MNGESLQNRLMLDYESICTDLEQILEDIGGLCGDRYFIKVLGEKNIQTIRERKDVIRKRLRGEFQLVVIGDFKRGKSTLINALLGQEAVPTAITPETVTINKLSYSDVPHIEAILKNRKRIPLSQAELTRESLNEIMNNLPASIDHVDIRLNHEYLHDITIVDTPGIGDLLKAFDEQVGNYLVNADAVIYVISARSPLSYTEQAFLSTSIMPQSFSRVFLVVNMADTLETKENLKKIKALVEDRAEAISDRIYVYLLSALDEYCRKSGLNRPEPDLTEVLETNFGEFENAIRNEIFFQKDIIKSTRGITLTQNLLGEIVSRIVLVQNSLKVNAEKLEKNEDSFKEQDGILRANIEMHKEKLSVSIAEMTIEAKGWMRVFLERMKKEIEGLNDTIDISDLQRYFQFYLMDHVKSAILACIQKHQKEIGDLLHSNAKEISGEISQSAYGNIQTQVSDSIADISWTSVDTAMFAGDVFLSMSGLSSVLGPLIIVGQAIAGVIRQRTMSKRQIDVITPVLQEFPSIMSSIFDNIDEIYAQIRIKALLKLDELYQNQIEISEGAIKQAREIASDENMKMQDVMNFLDGTLRIVQEYIQRLRDFE